MAWPLRRLLLWSALALVVVAGLVWSFWPQAVPVETVMVAPGPMRVEVSDEGRTRVREIYQVSAPVAGRLLRIEEHAGDSVVAGKTVVADLLPTAPGFLDVRTHAQAESAVKSAEAARDLAASEVKRAVAQLAFAGAELRRAALLRATDDISRANYDRAEFAHNTAAAQLGTARAALKAKEFDLETAKALLIDPSASDKVERARSTIPLYSPVSGKVLRVLHENESAVAQGTPILEVGDPKNLEIVVELISEDAVKVRAGMPATVTDWGGQGALRARVRRVEPSGFTKISALGVEEQRVNVLLDFADPPARWSTIADAFRVIVHVAIWENKKVLQVPGSAAFRRGTGWAVFAVDGNNRARLTPITVGKSNDETMEVRAGLVAGQRVIIHPSDRVVDGGRVSERAS